MSFDHRDWGNPFKKEHAHDGIERRVLAFTDDLMLVHYTVEEGAVFPEHEHEVAHQAVFVIEGAVELFGDRSGVLKAGDTFVVGPGIRHGIQGQAEQTRLIDAFTPPIDEYRLEW